MSRIDEAKAIYAIGRQLIAIFRTDPMLDDHVIWLIEDLDEALLDLKQAVMKRRIDWIDAYSLECSGLIAELQDEV